MSQKPTIKINTNIFGRINNINKNSFAIFITLLLAFVIGIGMHYHIMWKDELEEYSIIKHYLIPDNNLSYLVYHNLIKLFFLISPTQVMYQFINSLIIILTVFIFVFYSPFKNIEKFLFAFNYYFVYEYGIIARYYCFMLLIIFLIIFLISKVKRNYPLISILLIILATHSIICTILAASLSLYLILDVYNKILTKKLTLKKNFNLIFSAFIFFIGWLGTVLIHYFFTIKVSHDIYISNMGVPPIFLTINNIWNSYIPIPDLTQKVVFWHTNIIPYSIDYPFKYNINDYISIWNIFAFIISILILVISILKFSNKLIVLYTFLFNNIICFIFMQYFFRRYSANYIGPFFIIFIYSYWLYYITDEKNAKIQRFKIFFNLQKLFKPMLYIILIAQVFSSSYALSKGVKYKFTTSKDAADYIKQNNLQNTHIMVGYLDYITQCLCAHLDKKIFYVQDNKLDYCFFAHSWHAEKTKREESMDFNAIENVCTNFTEKQNKKALLILSFPLIYNNKEIFTGQAMLTQKSSIHFFKSFNEEAIVPDEEYWLYEVNKIDTNFNNNKELDVQDKFKEAMKFLTEAVKSKPDYSLAYMHLADCHQIIYNNDNALNFIDIGLNYTYHPKDPEVLNSKGHFLYVLGRYKEAMKFLTEAIKLKPDDSEIYFNLADCYQAIPDYDNAIKIMDIRLESAPNDYKVLDKKGHFLYFKGQYKEAIKFLTEAMQLKPDYGNPYFNLADCYQAMHDYDNAIKIMDIRLKNTPNDYHAFNNKGFYLLAQGKYNEAIISLRKAIKLKPNYSLTYMTLADCYHAMHDYDNELINLNIGLNYVPNDYKALNSKGYILYIQGKYKEAVIFLTEAIQLKPDYSNSYFNLTDCYQAMHDYDNALKTMNIRLKYAYTPNDYKALNSKGYFLYNQGQYKEAIEFLREAIQLKPDYSKAYINLADCYEVMHDYNNALKIIDIGLKYAPDDYNLLNNKGVILYNQGKYQEAMTFYKKAIKLNPQYGEAYMNIGSCYGMLHDYDNAVFYLGKSLKYNSNNIAAYKMLGLTYQNKGDRVSANVYYAKAKELEKVKSE